MDKDAITYKGILVIKKNEGEPGLITKVVKV